MPKEWRNQIKGASIGLGYNQESRKGKKEERKGRRRKEGRKEGKKENYNTLNMQKPMSLKNNELF
jgi:hypothetical protein